MVNLPKVESNGSLPVEEMFRRLQLEHNLPMDHDPPRLIELEEIAERAAVYMSIITSYPNLRQIAMNRLRQLFKLEFKMRCDLCGTAHNQDEITAPER